MASPPKKILIHSIAFSPDGVSTAYLYNDIAKAFKNEGYEVVVLTTTPHYNRVREELDKQPLFRRCLGLYYVSCFEGIKVIHVPQKKFKSTIWRLFGFIYWHLLSFVLGVAQRDVSVILSPSPPLTIGLINLWIGKIKGAKVVYNVQEIYPDLIIQQGGLKSPLLIGGLKWLEKIVYNRSDAVTTIDQVFYDTINSRFKDPSKLHIIPNFVDTELYRPFSDEQIKLDRSVFRHNDRTKLLYAGNIGHAQDWEPLIGIAEKLKDESFEFYVIGEGVMKPYLQKRVTELGLGHVYILPYQPRESMPHLLAFSDLQFIFMSKETEGHGFPSKVYTIMSCKKPLLICSGDSTPIVNFLTPIGCAKVVSETTWAEKVDELASFLRSTSKQELNGMGEKGFEIIKQSYSKEVVIKQYVSLINSLF